MTATRKVSRETSHLHEEWERFNSVPEILRLLKLGVKKNRIHGRYGVTRKTVHDTLTAVVRMGKEIEELSQSRGEEA